MEVCGSAHHWAHERIKLGHDARMMQPAQNVSAFSGPREFAAFLGLTPRQTSSGGKERLGRVSKMGNRYLRKLLVVGAHAVLISSQAARRRAANGRRSSSRPSPSPSRPPIQ